MEDPLFTRLSNERSGIFTGRLSAIFKKTIVLRKQPRMIGALPAQEIALMTEADGKRYYNFQLEYQGTVKSNTSHYVALELGTHEAGSDFKSSDEALAFWDRLTGSLRPIQ